MKRHRPHQIANSVLVSQRPSQHVKHFSGHSEHLETTRDQARHPHQPRKIQTLHMRSLPAESQPALYIALFSTDTVQYRTSRRRVQWGDHLRAQKGLGHTLKLRLVTATFIYLVKILLESAFANINACILQVRTRESRCRRRTLRRVMDMVGHI
jgi:hypothetical protein